MNIGDLLLSIPLNNVDKPDVKLVVRRNLIRTDMQVIENSHPKRLYIETKGQEQLLGTLDSQSLDRFKKAVSALEWACEF